MVSNLASSNGPMSDGVSITLRGINFANSNPTPSVAIEDTVCTTTAWTTGTSVLCSGAPYGSGSVRDSKVMMTVSALVGTRLKGFSFDSPVASSAHRYNSPTSGMISVTISGLNFGAKAPTPTVRMVDETCTTTSWSSATTVACGGTPSGLGKATVKLTVASLLGTSAELFTFDAPVISNSVNTNTVISGGASVTFLGLNFASKSYSSSAMINDQLCATNLWTTQTSLVCMYAKQTALEQKCVVNSATGDLACRYDAGKKLTMTVSAVVGTSAHYFTFDAPVISASSKNNMPTCSGTYMTLTGFNFGTTSSTPSGAIYDGQSQVVCATSQWLSNTAVQCGTPRGSGNKQGIHVTVSAIVGTRQRTFTWDAPVVSFQFNAMNSVLSSATQVTMGGMNFAVYDFTPTAALNSGSEMAVCSTTAWQTTTSVECTAGVGYGSNLNQIMTVSTQIGTRAMVFTYDSPVVSAAAQQNGVATTVFSVTISGLNFFGAKNLTPSASLDEATCATTAWTSGTTVNCMSAPYPTIGANLVKMTVSALVGCGQDIFTFDAPTVSYQMNQNTATCGTGSVTITGLNFAGTSRYKILIERSMLSLAASYSPEPG